jgi:hypothetical protein
VQQKYFVAVGSSWGEEGYDRKACLFILNQGGAMEVRKDHATTRKAMADLLCVVNCRIRYA